MRRRDQARGRRRPEELETREPGDLSMPAGAARVLALQRSAGNHAVSGLLARAPDAAKPKPEGAAASGTRATLPGIGTIPLLSVGFGATGAPTGGRSGRGGENDKPREIVLTSKAGEHSARLSKAALDGRPMAVEVIMAGGKSTITLKLAGAIVSSYSTSGDGDSAVESWALNFDSIEQTSEGGSGE